MRIAVVAAAAALLGGGCSNELKGSLTADLKPASKQWTTTPDECASGQRQGFFGADLRAGGQDDALIRVLLDPRDGPILKVNIPGGAQGLTLQPGPSCPRFDLHVERQNSTINDIANVRGHVRVDCDDAELKLQADITFANCH